MFEKFPSLIEFQPQFYTGGATRLHLPVLYDLVAMTRPRVMVALGFADGQAFFALCQAAREKSPGSRCIASRREGTETEDAAWCEGKAHGDKFYSDLAELRAEFPLDLAQTVPEKSVGFLLIDDCDSGKVLRGELSAWESKLAPDALVLLHGVQLERCDSVRAAWQEWTQMRPTAERSEGLGLGIAVQPSQNGAETALFSELFSDDAATVYRLADRRLEAEARGAQAARDRAALQVREVWLKSVLASGAEAQRVIQHQANTVREFESLRRDRAKAQLIMDSQVEQLRNFAETVERTHAERDKLDKKVKEQKRILEMAKAACRKRGNCFRIPVPAEEKKRRPLGEKIVREIRRAPKNLRGWWASPAVPPPVKECIRTPEPVSDRYTLWITEHEPDAVALDEQRRQCAAWDALPKISLLMPVFDTPAQFLDEMLESISRQTYAHWELCVIDAGSQNPETVATLASWDQKEARIRVRRLEQNLGIAENTNHALELAIGDFIACVDHDDLLAPFALYELACAIRDHPEAEILYSDEDRLSPDGKRHAPFFKPEWSPALLCSSMYLGHLTAYRRALMQELGGWRKEFDLSQDYDLALRATDGPRVIGHVPHVLYHWREHPQSGSAGGKHEARKTNLAALADAMQRRGFSAEIIEYPGANRARLKFTGTPKVSIIIPTDSPERAGRCLEHLPATTLYPDYEVVIVTNSALLEILRAAAPAQPQFHFVAYDKPFNFSEKCNLGAAAATGDRLIFYNDDVETEEREWIQNLIEPLENPAVGAVAPKLLYMSGRIQHAGLVTGVRGLIGTAFHQETSDTARHANLAQSMREVSALSGACLAMRRADFLRLGGWDAVHTPIAGSDLDLCFKVREAGMRCIYTPFATLHHAGHVSIGHKEMTPLASPRRDKSSIYLLRRWGEYVTRDPFFTDNMRDWLYADSPTPIRMSARNMPVTTSSAGDLLFVSHDLSLSGAPMMLLHAAVAMQRDGFFVTVLSPEDGPLRRRFEAAGIPIIIDPLAQTGHESFAEFARNFDGVIANTIFSAAIIHAARKAGVPVLWWLHETMAGEHYLREDPKLRSALPLADVVFAPSERAAMVYRPFRDRPIECLRNAVPDLWEEPVSKPAGAAPSPLEFLVLGTIEPRKGQDIFMQALAALPAELQGAAKFVVAGRVGDAEFGARVRSLGANVTNVSIHGPLSHEAALDCIKRADVLVCSSRDEAMPTVTILEAMSLGKAIISSAVGGADEFFVEGENALLVRAEAPGALAEAISRLIQNRGLVAALGRKARATYEERFTMERFGKEFGDLIRKSLGLWR